MNLASNDEHKESIINQGVIPDLVQLLKKGSLSVWVSLLKTRRWKCLHVYAKGTPGEKTLAAKTVWVLSFSKNNKKKMLENKDLVKSLKVLSKMEGWAIHLRIFLFLLYSISTYSISTILRTRNCQPRAWRQAATGAIWVLEEEKRINSRMQQSQKLDQNSPEAQRSVSW